MCFDRGRRGLKTIETQHILLRFNKGDAASKPLNYSMFCCVLIRATRSKNPRMITEFLPLFVCHNRLNTL